LHFGLGNARAVESATVHWPGGAAETVTGVEPGRRHTIVQGRGTAELLAPASGNPVLAAAPLPVPESDPAMRTWLVGRLPLPRFGAIPRNGKSALLVNLWSKTCAPCLAELAEWTTHAEALRAAGLDILALNVDGLLGGSAAVPPAAFPFRSAAATPELIEALEIFHRTFVELQQPLPVPSSFLLDRDGQVAAIYKGRVELDQLTSDAKLLDEPLTAQRDAAVPFAGRWASQPFPPQPRRFADAFATAGKPELRTRYLRDFLAAPGSASSETVAGVQSYLGSLLLAEGEPEAAVEVFAGLFKSAPNAASLHREAGTLLMQQNLAPPARQHLLAALPGCRDDPGFRFNLGIAEAACRNAEGALENFRAVVALDPRDAAAQFQIGNVLLATKRTREAIPHFRESLRLQPGWAYPANNLAWILATHPDPTLRNGAEALTLAKDLTAADGGRNPSTLSTLAAAYAETGDFTNASATLRQALALIPQNADAAVRGSFESALKTYEEGKPLRSP
jgi:Flp pilus assembly protein TadD/peroxiredoxin